MFQKSKVVFGEVFGFRYKNESRHLAGFIFIVAQVACCDPNRLSFCKFRADHIQCTARFEPFNLLALQL